MIERRQRKSAPRVKTGCITCKLRHVKCDEGKPACRRCTSTGRQCDGYTPLRPDRRYKSVTSQSQQVSTSSAREKQPSRTVLLDEKTLLSIHVNGREHRALDFFFSRVTSLLSDHFDTAFWFRLMIRFGSSEPAIRHAIVAVSTAYQEIEEAKSNSRGLRTSSPSTYPLQQYNKAISHLVKRLTPTNESTITPLIACFLFVCFECMQGNVGEAVRHVSSGVKMLEFYSNTTKLGEASPFAREFISEIDVIKQDLALRFSILDVAGSMINRAPAEFPLDENDLSDHALPLPLSLPRFRDLGQVRSSVYTVFAQAMRIIRTCMQRKSTFCANAQDLAKHAYLQNLLDLWRFSFGEFVSQNRSIMSSQDEEFITITRLNIEMLNIVVRVLFFPIEVAFDNHIPSFIRIIELAETVIPSKKSVHFGFGYLIPLFWTACKCRHPVIRRKAVRLLYKAVPRVEAIYSAEIHYKLAIRVIELEEGNLNPEHKGLYFPPEERRIVHVFADTDASGRTPVTFIWKPDGLEGQFKTKTEYLNLSDGILPPLPLDEACTQEDAWSLPLR